MPSIRLSESIELERPIDDVFSVVTDPALWVRGETGLTIEVDEPMKAGSAVRSRFEFKGKTHHSEGVITAYARPHRFGLSVRGEPFNVAAQVDLQAKGTNTRVNVEAEIAPSAWVFGLSFVFAGRFMHGKLSQVLRLKLAEFKTEIEASG